MDTQDKTLLRLLQENCKKTTKQYATELNLSTTAVYERIKRLERDGFIDKYVALVDKEKVEKNFTVFCHVKLIQHTKSNIVGFEKQILELAEVKECHHTSGDYDYILIVHLKNMQEYRKFMVNKLTTIDQIGSTQSSFVIDTVKSSSAVVI